MKAMIELSGEITNSVIYLAAPTTIADTNGLDCNKLQNLGFDCFAHVDDTQIQGLEMQMCQSKKEVAEVRIITQDFTSVIKPKCNVDVKIIRDYGILQWIGFGALWLYRQIKGWKYE